jgi:hypothetical protein
MHLHISMKTALALVLFIGACGAPHHREARTAAATRPAPPSAVHLLTSINELEAPRRDTDHTRVLAAFQALGEALHTAAPGRSNEILRVKASCNALERSVTNTRARADFVRIGLSAATDALATVAPSDPNVAAMAAATSRIDPDRPLSDQYAQVRTALRASVRVVFAVEGASEPTIAPARTIVTATR